MAKAQKKKPLPGAPPADIKHASKKVVDDMEATKIQRIVTNLNAAGPGENLEEDYAVVRPLLYYFHEQLLAGSSADTHLMNFLQSMDAQYDKAVD